MSAARLQVERVSRRFRDPDGNDREALREVSLEIAPGEFVGILGASGCGKTTLLNLLAGFDLPSRGRVLANGQEITGPSPSRVGMFQGYALFPWRSVQANVEFGLEVRGAARADRRAVATRLLELVGLSDFASHRPHQLSGGMQQRAALARALAVDPDCLLMDEPFGALDALTRGRLQNELARITHDQGKTVVFVTHDVDEAVFLADRVVVMVGDPGRIERVIPVPLRRPRSRTSAEFLAVRGEVYRALESAHVFGS